MFFHVLLHYVKSLFLSEFFLCYKISESAASKFFEQGFYLAPTNTNFLAIDLNSFYTAPKDNDKYNHYKPYDWWHSIN